MMTHHTNKAKEIYLERNLKSSHIYIVQLKLSISYWAYRFLREVGSVIVL